MKMWGIQVNNGLIGFHNIFSSWDGHYVSRGEDASTRNSQSHTAECHRKHCALHAEKIQTSHQKVLMQNI